MEERGEVGMKYKNDVKGAESVFRVQVIEKEEEIKLHKCPIDPLHHAILKT
jgi:hypothetical protein